jgi:hypothetical protein
MVPVHPSLIQLTARNLRYPLVELVVERNQLLFAVSILLSADPVSLVVDVRLNAGDAV